MDNHFELSELKVQPRLQGVRMLIRKLALVDRIEFGVNRNLIDAVAVPQPS